MTDHIGESLPCHAIETLLIGRGQIHGVLQAHLDLELSLVTQKIDIMLKGIGQPFSGQHVIAQLEAQMREAAKKFEFERAAGLRDRIRALQQRELGGLLSSLDLSETPPAAPGSPGAPEASPAPAAAAAVARASTKPRRR